MPEAIEGPSFPTTGPNLTFKGRAGYRFRGMTIVEWLKIVPIRAAILLLVLFYATRVFAQDAPDSPNRQWLGPGEQQIKRDAEIFHDSNFSIEQAKTYSLAELIDFAQAHNPETRFTWERARAQAAALGVARSELYPTLAAIALSDTNRFEVLFGNSFFRQSVQTFEVAFELNYTVFDFGARAGRIDAAKAEVLAANFAFNDTHRKIIYRVEKAFYELLNASGQVDAARTSLLNAQTVQRATEDRLKQGLGTLPDVLQARSATAQAQFELQTVLGDKEIARGDLATALGVAPTSEITVQSINDLSTPESIGDTVERAINRAFEQRPDLLQQVAEIQSANARVKEARAAYRPSLNLNAGPALQSLNGIQQGLPGTHTTAWAGRLSLTLNWTLFDGGARKNNLARAQANLRAAEAQVNVTRDQIANEIWAAYSNLHTAFMQRQAAIAFLESASQSYAAALEAYNYGVRSLLDVTAAQRTLAQAQSADVFARARVLSALAELAFQIGDKRP
jgi:outer membrane protein